MVGRLLEAEGCVIGNLPKYYARGGMGLLRQMMDMDDLVIVDSFANLWYWLGEAQRFSTMVRGTAGQCVQDVWVLWKTVEDMPELARAAQVMHQNKKELSAGSKDQPIFAILTEKRSQGKKERYHMLEKEHCLQLMRGELKRADMTFDADMNALKLQPEVVKGQAKENDVGKAKGKGKKKGRGKR
ncbi:hypothetical protein LTS10_000828 [Elasticomyces elasticus]|nr:hypothetical protein LTS10_000828 [Elasticomyces elasticus]